MWTYPQTSAATSDLIDVRDFATVGIIPQLTGGTIDIYIGHDSTNMKIYNDHNTSPPTALGMTASLALPNQIKTEGYSYLQFVKVGTGSAGMSYQGGAADHSRISTQVKLDKYDTIPIKVDVGGFKYMKVTKSTGGTVTTLKHRGHRIGAL